MLVVHHRDQAQQAVEHIHLGPSTAAVPGISRNHGSEWAEPLSWSYQVLVGALFPGPLFQSLSFQPLLSVRPSPEITISRSSVVKLSVSIPPKDHSRPCCPYFLPSVWHPVGWWYHVISLDSSWLLFTSTHQCLWLHHFEVWKWCRQAGELRTWWNSWKVKNRRQAWHGALRLLHSQLPKPPTFFTEAFGFSLVMPYPKVVHSILLQRPQSSGWGSALTTYISAIQIYSNETHNESMTKPWWS